jgi:hypothetical protein
LADETGQGWKKKRLHKAIQNKNDVIFMYATYMSTSTATTNFALTVFVLIASLICLKAQIAAMTHKANMPRITTPTIISGSPIGPP